MTGHDLLLLFLGFAAGGMTGVWAVRTWQRDRDRRWP